MFSWLNRFQGFGALVMRLVLGVIMVRHGYTKIIPSGALYDLQPYGRPHALAGLARLCCRLYRIFWRHAAHRWLVDPGRGVDDAVDMAVAIIKVHLHGGLMGPNSFAFPLACFSRPDAGLYRLRVAGAG